MSQVFVLRCDWNICGDTGADIVSVCSSYESACRDLKTFVNNEKQTSLEVFFANGVIKNNISIDDYEDKDNYFLFTTKDGEWYIEVYIECIEVKA